MGKLSMQFELTGLAEANRELQALLEGLKQIGSLGGASGATITAPLASIGQQAEKAGRGLRQMSGGLSDLDKAAKRAGFSSFAELQKQKPAIAGILQSMSIGSGPLPMSVTTQLAKRALAMGPLFPASTLGKWYGGIVSGPMQGPPLPPLGWTGRFTPPMTQAMSQAGAARVAAMGPLLFGPRLTPPLTQSMTQAGAARVAAMGPLNPTGATIDWKTAMLGMAMGPFSAWIGARMLSSSGLFTSIGKSFGGAGGGGLFGHLVGAGGLGGFGVAFLALTTATKALRMAFQELMNSIKAGAQMFYSAARLAKPVGQVYGLEQAFRAMGIGPAAIEKLMLQGQLAGRGTAINYNSVLRAGMGTMEQGELQQLRNMPAELFNDMQKRSEYAAQRFQVMSYDMVQLAADTQRLGEEWRLMWMELFRSLKPELEYVMARLVDIMQMLGKSVRGLKFFIAANTNQTALAMQLLIEEMGWSTGKQPGTLRTMGGASSSNANSWMRMGFVVGTFGQDYAKQTAANTKRIADILAGTMGAPGMAPAFTQPYFKP